ncbi:MAG TPA: T9SS type A sorting domain-containing protein [Ignavibacteria bacterium]|nr:T9SS type A sorting domain-containing protein [Ignavibacteria bacterium]
MKRLLILLAVLFITSTSYSQWEQATGIPGGSATCFAAIGNKIFAGTKSGGGVSYSSDNGVTWIQKGMYNLAANCMTIMGNKLFIGTDANGIYTSTNEGQTWDQSSLNNVSVFCFAISGSNIFAGTYNNGILYTSDMGISWHQTSLASGMINSLTVSGSTIFAGTPGGVKKSDNGLDWTSTSLNSFNVLCITATNSILYAGTYGDGLFYSTNNGANWSDANAPTSFIKSLTSNGPNILMGGIHPGIYVSTNYGLNWKTSIIGSSVNQVYIHNNVFFGGTNFGIFFSSNNGVNWSQTSLNNQSVYSLAQTNGLIYAGTYNRGVYTSKDNGLSWVNNTHWYYGVGDGPIKSLLTTESKIFAASNLGMYSSTNYGYTWVGSGIPFVNQIIKNGPDIYYCTELWGIRKSTDGGTQWSWTIIPLPDIIIKTICISGNKLFAGTPNGILATTNEGVNWFSSGLNDKWINYLLVFGGNIFAGTREGLYFSQDNGSTWIPRGLSNMSVLTFATYGSTIFTGTSTGVYLSKNNGESWIQKNQGIEDKTINSLLINEGYIIAGTMGSSVWRREYTDIVGIDPVSNVVPDKHSLYQNYPNPFNPTTNIKFDLKEKSNVKLAVYNSLGKEVAVLINKELTAGSYSFDWNAENFSSGIYFYRMTTDKFVETKKMLLIK